MDSGGKIIYPVMLQPLCRKSVSRHSHIKHLGYGGAYSTFIDLRIAKHHIVSYYARLTVGRTGKIIEPCQPRDRMHKFNGITHGIYVAVRCTEVLVNLNAAHRTELDSGSIHKSEKFLKFIQAFETGLGYDSGSRLAAHQLTHDVYFLCGRTGNCKYRPDYRHGLFIESLFFHLSLNRLQSDFINLVNGNSYVHDLVREAANLRHSGQDFAVVYLYAHVHVKQGEDPVNNLHKFQLIQK